jgi:2-keto-4-pentenoate hydratase
MVDIERLADHIDQPGIDADADRDILKVDPGLTREDALAVQLAVKRRQVARGDRIVGHQASFTSRAVQAAFPDAPVPMVGTLTASLLLNGGDIATIGSDPTVIETELGILLKRDLEGANLSDAEVLAAIEGFFPAIEVAPVRPGVREGAFSWQHMIAVQKAVGGFVAAGSRLTKAKGFDPRLEGCLVSIDGVPKGGAIGYEAMGNPLRVVAAMAERLGRIGERLRAGQFLITGSLPAPQLLTRGDRCVTVEFSTLGPLDIRLQW